MPFNACRLGGGKFVVGGGGGEEAPGRPNKATLVVGDSGRLSQVAEVDFGVHCVESLAYHGEIGIVATNGCEVHRLKASGKVGFFPSSAQRK